MLQATFLVTVIAGALTLVAAVGTARMHWRVDVTPYRETYAFNVLRHPAAYVRPQWAAKVRILAIVGVCLLVLAVGCLAFQLAIDAGAR